MTTKEYLGQIRRYDRMIQNKIEELKNVRSSICGISSFSGGDRVQTSGGKDTIGSGVTKAIVMESEIKTLIDKRAVIVKQIESITDTDLYDILAKRFILNKDFKVIGIEMNKSKSQTFHLQDNALEVFERKFGNIYK